MSDEIKQGENTPADGEFGAIKTKLDGFEAALAKLMGVLENTSAAKAGYVTQDGGTKDANIKSFGDFLVAIKRGDEKRLSGIYGSVKDLGEGSGAAGGFLVPEEYSMNLLQVAAVQNQIYGRVQYIPVTRESGTYPALTSIFAHRWFWSDCFLLVVKGTFTAPGATFTETEPSFSKLSWRLNKVGGITEVENELIEDSPFAIEALLRGLFAVAIAARNERNILRGSGVGEPLGILNCEAAIGIDDATTGDFVGRCCFDVQPLQECWWLARVGYSPLGLAQDYEDDQRQHRRVAGQHAGCARKSPEWLPHFSVRAYEPD